MQQSSTNTKYRDNKSGGGSNGSSSNPVRAYSEKIQKSVELMRKIKELFLERVKTDPCLDCIN